MGLLYHLYNQFAFNTLARVSPVSHGVCNVVKRVAIIGTSGASAHQACSIRSICIANVQGRFMLCCSEAALPGFVRAGLWPCQPRCLDARPASEPHGEPPALQRFLPWSASCLAVLPVRAAAEAGAPLCCAASPRCSRTPCWLGAGRKLRACNHAPSAVDSTQHTHTPAAPPRAASLPAVLFFGNKLTAQTQIGTAVALIGTWLYTEASKKKPAPKTA